MDFYQLTSEKAQYLSSTEKAILNFVTRNLQLVKRMSIRELAADCYVSTTTILRFVRKMGFAGYAEFQDVVCRTEEQSRKLTIPDIVQKENYRDSYLKNVIEAVKVITDEKIEKFDQIMMRYPKIFILAEGMSAEVANYFYRLFKVIGYDVELPRKDYELRSVERRIKREDVLLVLSYSGDNAEVVRQIEHIFTYSTPTIISVTRADNNVIQNMSDLNFYFFADEISYEGKDITSRCGMIAILETLLYKRMTRHPPV
ncbi:MAG: MurR/RpiR family transcriptional regulator [Oscillospiraceae bacterium]|nr:MurR/RpiR family transcriptional regulator [Oscillospiraceae bacterium]